MSKRYLSLEEAAQILSIPTDELIRLRERGEIRGFADRGNWKFKQEDVETLLRSRQADSNPEVPLLGDDDASLVTDDDSTPDSLSDSDSDVKLVGGADVDLSAFDSDSDVKLVGLGSGEIDQLGEGTDPEIPLKTPDSDSDVTLVRPDSDSDVKLPGDDSDSDVKLAPGESDADIGMKTDEMSKSDSDVKLVPDDNQIGDVTLIAGSEDAIPVDDSSVLDDDSGISLESDDSSLMLGSESGINLEGPSDSGIALDEDDDEGITLALDEDSGISLDSGDSGISLESADSGISLESGDSGISLDDTVGGGTVPMMDVVGDDDVAETQFEMSAADDDSGYAIGAADADETGVLDLESSELDDAVFDLDDEQAVDETGEFDGDDLDLEDDAFEDEEDLDVFDADDEVFEGAESDAGYAAAGRMPTSESDWGMPTFIGLTIASLCLVLCGVVMIDLVKNTATASQPNPVSGMVLDMLGGIYR